jgi:hypothetical protein
MADHAAAPVPEWPVTAAATRVHAHGRITGRRLGEPAIDNGPMIVAGTR